jgi:hypothetical protein
MISFPYFTNYEHPHAAPAVCVSINDFVAGFAHAIARTITLRRP